MAVVQGKNSNVDWNVDMEVQLFHAMRGHKPVGVNRYFQMACIHEKFSNSINKEISSKEIWTHLDTMYDMAALHDSEILPFPNSQIDFNLPASEFSSFISDKSDDAPLALSAMSKGNKGEATPTKASGNSVSLKQGKNITPGKATHNLISPSSKVGKADATVGKSSVQNVPVSSKIGKGDVASVKTESKLNREHNTTPKGKHENSSSLKVNRPNGVASHTSTKSQKTETASSSQKGSKVESNSETTVKKTGKHDGTGSSKKTGKSDFSDNGANKKLKNDSDGHSKKIKPDVNTESSDVNEKNVTAKNKKKLKSDNINGIKKTKSDSEGSVKKSSESSAIKSGKPETKGNVSNLTKVLKGDSSSEDGTSTTTASAKTNKILPKEDGTESSSKRKRQRQDEQQQKKTSSAGTVSTAKRRRT